LCERGARRDVKVDSLGTEAVEIELDEETLERLEEKAFRDHRDSRAAAVSDLLDEWLKRER
jgi:Ribbon-helix-helix protein, copG family.